MRTDARQFHLLRPHPPGRAERFYRLLFQRQMPQRPQKVIRSKGGEGADPGGKFTPPGLGLGLATWERRISISTRVSGTSLIPACAWVVTPFALGHIKPRAIRRPRALLTQKGSGFLASSVSVHLACRLSLFALII